ncbi:acyl carrier protein, partial [Nocardioides alcanivorans]
MPGGRRLSDLGGDSLTALRLVASLCEDFGVDVTLA